MSQEQEKGLVGQVLSGTKGLPPVARLVLARYAASAKMTSEGTVMELAKDMAEDLGMTATQFSRERRRLIAGGYLVEDPARRVGTVSHFKININGVTAQPKQPEVAKVIPLRTTA
jgi:hypothetical protein